MQTWRHGRRAFPRRRWRAGGVAAGRYPAVERRNLAKGLMSSHLADSVCVCTRVSERDVEGSGRAPFSQTVNGGMRVRTFGGKD